MSNTLYGRFLAVVALLLACTLFLTAAPTDAADHADSPAATNDRPADLGDTYAFLDPNDPSKVVLIMTVVGFIAPAEQVNMGFFDPRVRYRFELEETGDARADRFIDITFSEQTSRTMPQTATIVLPDGRTTITAPTTVPTLAESDGLSSSTLLMPSVRAAFSVIAQLAARSK